ncbi:unnamed protein product [Chironomus riparius]|uniref:DUF4806 domain-containing protein n=1 Tax=Chironomus riparius TaxID=315576 RepID=A0A9N9RXR1_9DIPT|nr:unnamed protein product [Chironomus riparius]CAG9805886.1 unnamed protein product [Chironomus riparius]
MAGKNSKKKSDQVVQNRPFLCASFDDGLMMVVHTTWIKEQFNESRYENIPKENIILWDSKPVIIECSHETMIQARCHQKELSASDDESKKRIKVRKDPLLQDLENTVRDQTDGDASKQVQNAMSVIEETVAEETVAEETVAEETVVEENSSERIDQLIEGAVTVDDLKIILKSMNGQLKRKNEDSPTNDGNKKSRTNPIEKKIASIEDFNMFLIKATESQEYKENLVRYWKKMPGTEGMTKFGNGKLHAILLSIFDLQFLNDSVLWGKLCVKEDAAGDKKLYLKVHGIFLEMLKDVLNLDDGNPTKTLGDFIKNILNNKIKRDMKAILKNSKKN